MGRGIVTVVLLTFGQQSFWLPCHSAANISQIIQFILCIWDTTQLTGCLQEQMFLLKVCFLPALLLVSVNQQKCWCRLEKRILQVLDFWQRSCFFHVFYKDFVLNILSYFKNSYVLGMIVLLSRLSVFVWCILLDFVFVVCHKKVGFFFILFECCVVWDWKMYVVKDWK